MSEMKNGAAEMRRMDECDGAEAIRITTSLEVKAVDEAERMTWDAAMEKFGADGVDADWRLPTYVELAAMYATREAISGLNKDGFYWSSDGYTHVGFKENVYDCAWVQSFADGGASRRKTFAIKQFPQRVRLVRRFSSER